MNAAFGNAAELIIAGIALSKGLTSVVKASITGSIVGNILLVLGLSVLFGGIKHKEQRFNQTGARLPSFPFLSSRDSPDYPHRFHMSAAASPGGWSGRQWNTSSR